jgi:N-acetylneuraminic acid mutarotase
MRTPRRSATSTIVNGYLYGIGGYNGTFLKTLERAPIRDDGSLGTWEDVPQPMENAHYIHGGATLNNRIYVFGGHVQGVGLGDKSTEWTTVADDGKLSEWQPGTELHQARFLAGATASENFLFVVGGYDGGYLASVEEARIHPDGRLGDWVQAIPLPGPREGAAVAVHGDTLYAIGGSRDGHYLSTVEYAHIGQDGTLGHWETQPAGKPD